MQITKFTGFYPSRPFWAGSPLDPGDQTGPDWLFEQMSAVTYSRTTDQSTINICRDGRILIRVETLESSISAEDPQKIDEIVEKWGEYLDYLNAFYLLLDSATLEKTHLSYFNLHEITNRDAFRVRFEDGVFRGESIAAESIASTFQMGRFQSTYRPGVPIEMDPRIVMRQLVSNEALSHACDSFAVVLSKPGLQKTLATYAKSLSEYKIGNYETSIVLSWFITEASISQLWETHIDGLNHDLGEKRKRINSERLKYLTGRDFSASAMSNLLELWDALPNDLFTDIDKVRGFRNRIVHQHDFTPDSKHSQLSLNTARAMIDQIWGFRFTPNTGYSVHGF